MFTADKLTDYTILDTGDGMKLEKWGKYTLMRPDPQVIWEKSKPELWEKADAVYERSHSGGGRWSYNKNYRINGFLIIKTSNFSFARRL